LLKKVAQARTIYEGSTNAKQPEASQYLDEKMDRRVTAECPCFERKVRELRRSSSNLAVESADLTRIGRQRLALAEKI